MDFAFSEEQDEFREMLRRFLEERSPSTEVRRLMETDEGFDRDCWKQMAEELGLQGLHIPEEYGGQGFGALEVAIAFEEMGRVLLCAPYFSTVALAANALLEAGSDDARSKLLPGIASGTTIATLALCEPDSGTGWRSEDIALEASPDGDGYRLRGEKAPVLDAHVADLLLVAARLPGTTGSDGITLLAVDRGASGLEVELLETLDATRKQARVRFADTPARAIGSPGQDGVGLERTLRLAASLLSNESAGGAQRCLEAAVDYAKVRLQFGRPIGSFQAIKHRCADLLMEVEAAKAAAHWAAWVGGERPDELADAANIAKALSSDAFVQASEDNMHIHGGMGFTFEADPQLYVKRAKTNEELLGNAVAHRIELMGRRGV